VIVAIHETPACPLLAQSRHSSVADQMRFARYGTSLGAVKRKEIFEPAGTALDYIAALKLLNTKAQPGNRQP